MTTSENLPRVSVLMPTYDHRYFIRRAIESLLAQKLADWELIIVDDASPDDTAELVKPYLSDSRIQYHRLPENRGTGAAINYALDRAQAPRIAYLPSDDVIYDDHLSSLVACLDGHPEAILAYSGVRHHYNRMATGQIDGYSLQPIQVMHRRTADRWVERQELVSDDIDRLYWSKLRPQGEFIGTELISCEWVDHPRQLHKIVREPIGGINTYRSRFKVQHPLRFHTTQGNFIDEVEHYRRFRERPDTPMAPDGLRIVLCGELAYSPERVLALEEQGHKLYGLWMPEPYWYNTVGPLPFGHVQDIPRENWQAELRRIQPDVIYALLNWQAIPWIRQVLLEVPEVPLVFHFKEGPFICLEQVHDRWEPLIDIYEHCAGQIYCTPEHRDWMETVIPGITQRVPTLILDGDLPKRDWLQAERSPRLSATDGEIHTVVPGRPIGLHPYNVEELAQQGVHLHFYGDFTHGQWLEWIAKTNRMVPGYLHLHANVDQEDWVTEFSKYDAGWLHLIKSHNQGDIRRANWDDLNMPARISTLVAAGLPILLYDNRDAVVAMQTIARHYDIGVFFTNMAELRQQLDNHERMAQIRDNVWRNRAAFTMDYHVPRLVDFFRQVIDFRSTVT